MKIRTASGWILLVGSISCTTLKPGAEKIRVTANPDVVKGCEFIGTLRANEMSAETSTWKLQNDALKLGADTLFVTSQSAGGAHQLGEAYKCKQ
jgi:Domain of unknown function (DUF4156)